MTIEARLARLEMHNRRYRNLLMLAGLVTIALAGYGAAQPQPDIVRAKKFEVVNNAGIVVAELGGFKGVLRQYLGEGSLILRDEKGKITTTLENNYNGDAYLTLRNRRGGTVYIGPHQDEMSIQIDAYQTENPVFIAYADGNGNGRLIVNDKAKSPLLSVSHNGHGGRLVLYNKHRVPVAEIYAKEDGSGIVQTLAPAGGPREERR